MKNDAIQSIITFSIIVFIVCIGLVAIGGLKEAAPENSTAEKMVEDMEEDFAHAGETIIWAAAFGLPGAGAIIIAFLVIAKRESWM